MAWQELSFPSKPDRTPKKAHRFYKRRQCFTFRLTVIFLLFSFILYLYVRCYHGINTVFHGRKFKAESYEHRIRYQSEPERKHILVDPSAVSRSGEFFLLKNDSAQNFHTKYRIIPKYNREGNVQINEPDDENENHKNFSENHILNLRKIIENLKSQWLRYMTAGLDWKGILNPCKTEMEWESKISETINRTSGNTSKISFQDVQPAGEFSRFFIQSKTADGRIKTIGGDSWRVYLFGPASLVAKIFDYGNGTYEAMFLVMEPGVYKVIVILDYSLCDGLRDPPRDWFSKGNKHGKYQKDGTLGRLDDFLFQRLVSSERPLTITVPSARVKVDFKDILSSGSSACTRICRFLWNGYGRWVNQTWIPFFQEPLHWHDYPQPSPTGTLWVYGDSVAMIFVQSMRKRSICSKLYKQCKLSYNWVYPILSGHKRAIEENDDLDFDEERVLKTIRDVLSHPDMDSNSTLLLNFGLHFIMTINFTGYKNLIDNVVRLLANRREHDVKVIWKTTTAILKENARDMQLTHFRFLTSPRILLFNAYATWAMCRAGIDVVDVHPVTDSYPSGPMDVVHYYGFVTYPLEQRLEAFKINTVLQNKKDNYIITACSDD